ncbi:hypothetical protein ACX80D_09910 [Arthrobacter sp. Sr24]
MNDSAPDPNAMPAPATLSGEDVGGAKMPLGVRRLLLIGGFCIPVGFIATAYFFGAQLLLAAGIAAVAVAFSYQGGHRWFAAWSRFTAFSGAAWLLVTVLYWLAIISAESSGSRTSLPTILFGVGVGAFVVMAVSVLGGCVSRYLNSRRTADVRE